MEQFILVALHFPSVGGSTALIPEVSLVVVAGVKMASSAAARAAGAARAVKPILSRDVDEAKRRVRELYRAWYREVPNTGNTVRIFYNLHINQ